MKFISSASFGDHVSTAAMGNDVALAYARVSVEAGSVLRVFASLPGERPVRRRAVR